MNTLRFNWVARGGFALAVMLGGGVPARAANRAAITTAVYAQTGNGYQREKLPDGSFKREYYVMSNAGKLPGTLQDNQQAKVPFARIAGILAEYLARQNYYPAPDEASAQLALVVHWGTTIPFNGVLYDQALANVGNAQATMKALGGGQSTPALGGGNPFAAAEGAAAQAAEADFEYMMLLLMLENKNRERANERNARMLGYIREINESNGIQRWAGGGDYYNDLIADIEETRYYVVISAYDFGKTVKEKKPTLQWVTRVSIRSPGNSFNERLDAMIANAAKFFGQESGRLVRRYEEREGRVEVGESTVVGVVAEPAKPGAPARVREDKNP